MGGGEKEEKIVFYNFSKYGKMTVLSAPEVW